MLCEVFRGEINSSRFTLPVEVLQKCVMFEQHNICGSSYSLPISSVLLLCLTKLVLLSVISLTCSEFSWEFFWILWAGLAFCLTCSEFPFLLQRLSMVWPNHSICLCYFFTESCNKGHPMHCQKRTSFVTKMITAWELIRSWDSKLCTVSFIMLACSRCLAGIVNYVYHVFLS